MPKKKIIKKTNNGIFSQFKFGESYTSLILGAIVVLIAGILFLSFAKGNKVAQTSSVKEEPRMEQQKSQDDSKTSSTYTIKPGDDLWSISENVYKDGYKWIEIAKANNIENPGLIYTDNKLIIPTVAQSQQIEVKSQVPIVVVAAENAIENSSISGNIYTIKSGDNLWDISVRAYGDGFRWPEIARANNLEDPGLIFSGNTLKIPR
ncbi:MAG: LysM peptidoglycan-binding domain-containing protein [bacterium]|nr:LysM peptidoglycan-binding domain-containing protein [bacterium]